MKKFTKISFIISGVLAVVGIAFMISGLIMGVRWQDVEDSLFINRGSSWLWELRSYDYTGDMEKTYRYDASGIQKLDIEFNRGELNVSETDGSEILVVTYNGKDKVKLEGGTLKVESKGKSNLDNTIEIQIPEGKTFEEAEIKVDAGSGTVDRLEAKELDAEVNAGDLTFYEKITAKKVTLDVDAGNIDTDLLDAEEIKIECDAGSVTTILAGKEEDYRLELDSDMASVELGNEEYSGLSAKRQWGDSNASRKFKADCNAGSLDIEFEQE